MANIRRSTRTVLILILCSVALGLQGCSTLGPDRQLAQEDPKPRHAQATFLKTPLHFEANEGQTDAQVKFLSRGPGYGLFLTPSEAVLALRKATPTPSETATDETPSESAVLRMRLVGGNPTPELSGETALPGKVNYFKGNDPKKWRTNVPTYAKARYANVYPGIDLVYYGNQRQLEYDFVVAPGQDPTSITMAFEGMDRLELDATGDLVLQTSSGVIRQRKPIIYQEVAGERQAIEGSYLLKPDDQVGFQVAAYDTTKPLIIDPVMVFSTYLGGSDNDGGSGIAVDGVGQFYVTGTTRSSDFPTVNPLQPTHGGSADAFVTQLTADGSALVYSTYLGGSDNDFGLGIAVNGAGQVSVTGATRSTDFPVLNAFQPARRGISDAFVAQLTADGAALVYSTYLGGSGIDDARGIALDYVGQAYVTGQTGSRDFPVLNAFQPTHGGDLYDAFVTQLTTTGGLGYSTYLGGSNHDESFAIAVDGERKAYVTGITRSTDFPTMNPIQPDFAGPSGQFDAFVTKLNAGGTLGYSTYLGGSASDDGLGIAVDGMGRASVTGFTSSTDFPTQNPLQPTFAGGGVNVAGGGDAFVTQLSSDGMALNFSTYLGGSSSDGGSGIAVDGAGQVYVTGGTSSTDFPTQNPLQPAIGGGEDAFVVKIDPLGLLVPQDFATIQEAINVAAADTTILVGPGTYDEGIDFEGKKLVILSTHGPASTSIRDVAFTNNEPEGTILNGFRITGVMDIFNGASPTIKNCQLDASETGRAISGGHGSINASSPTFMDCKISGGEAVVGGGFDVRNSATATFIRCTFFDNLADEGAALWIASDSSATFNNSIVRNNHGEGALHNAGELVLTESLIEQNDRIGIINHGTGSATITKTTIAENNQHGIQNQDNAVLHLEESTVITLSSAGLQVEGGTVHVVNSTLSGMNQGHPGIGVFGGAIDIVNSTISAHGEAQGGGGIGFGGPGGTVTLQNTILAGNTANVGPDCDGPVTSLGNNIIGDPSGCTIVLQPTDRTGNPGLGAFAEGTPGRGHFPLLLTSQAIDGGNNDACSPTDQLGKPRVDGGPIKDDVIICDIGSIESQAQAQIQNLNDKFAPLGSGDVGTAFSPTPCGGAAVGTFTVTATFTNISADTLSNLLIAVQTLTGGNVLCNADGGPGGAGFQLTVPPEGDLADGQLSPGESFVVELPVGLQSFNPFTFFVDVLGEVVGLCPCVGLRDGETVWDDSYATLSCTNFFNPQGRFRNETRLNSSVTTVESLSVGGSFCCVPTPHASCSVGQTEINIGPTSGPFTACENSLRRIAANDGVACVGP